MANKLSNISLRPGTQGYHILLSLEQGSKRYKELQADYLMAHPNKGKKENGKIKHSIHYTLHRMLAQGIIIKVQRGLYSLKSNTITSVKHII